MSEEKDAAGAPALARGVVVGHGSMATGLVDAVRRIAGIGDDVLVPVSNEGKGPDALREELDRVIGSGRAVVFTDMHAGSCAVAARFACREHGGQAAAAAATAGRAAVCGVNLPMLLDFVFNRELPLEQLVPRLVEHGRAAVIAPNADPAAPR